jgi:hypothetical protein
MMKDLESLKHQENYYKDTTQEVMILRADFLENMVGTSWLEMILWKKS